MNSELWINLNLKLKAFSGSSWRIFLKILQNFEDQNCNLSRSFHLVILTSSERWRLIRTFEAKNSFCCPIKWRSSEARQNDETALKERERNQNKQSQIYEKKTSHNRPNRSLAIADSRLQSRLQTVATQTNSRRWFLRTNSNKKIHQIQKFQYPGIRRELNELWFAVFD